MGLTFVKNLKGSCCLCGSRNDLTGEHKIPASVLREVFPNGRVYLIDGGGLNRPRLAQSHKSKVFHFESKICRDCNSSRTQKADRAFVKFHKENRGIVDAGNELAQIDPGVVMLAQSNEELNRFRYFAKLLCCFIAEVGGPRPRQVANFAIGQTDKNPILLHTKSDQEFFKAKEGQLDHTMVSHGGLTLMFDLRHKRVNSIQSSLNLSGVSYEFGVSLRWYAQAELRWLFPDFVEDARRKTIDMPPLDPHPQRS